MADDDQNLTIQVHDRVDRLPNVHGGEFLRVYGSIFHGGSQRGVYAADLLEQPHEGIAILAIGLMAERAVGDPEKCVVVIETWFEQDAHETRFGVRSPDLFAHVSDVFMDAQALERDDFFAEPDDWRAWIFHAAEHIVTEDPRVNAHTANPRSTG